MKAYLLTVTGAVLLSAVLSIVIPEGKMGKFLRGMVSLFVFSAVIFPLYSLAGKEPALSQGTIELNGDYLKTVAGMLCREDEERVVSCLLEEFSCEAEAEVLRSSEGNFPREKITVKIFGISAPEEHIDMVEKIRKMLEEKFGCPTEVIWLVKE